MPLLVSLGGFTVLHVAPGGPAAIYAMSPTMAAEDMERLTRELGLDQPLHVQYVKWAAGLATANWGRSYRDGRVVLEVIADRVPATLVLMLSAFSVAVLTGLTTGIVSAVRQYSLFDHTMTLTAMVALSIPTFWLGLMGIYVFAELLRVLPPGNIGTVGGPFSLGDRLRHLVLPASTLGVVMVATWSRYTRASMLEVIGEDYIRTALAKGVSRGAIILKHALKNALIPLVTLAGLQLPLVFSGALVTETIFTLSVARAILLESYISFLGYGIQPPLASWGNMLNNAQSYFASAPWVAIFPGVMITLAVTSFNFLGDGLRDALDPRHVRARA
jgi:peptide/nickel transport system permease protein